jgi:uncharacterized protein (DUF1778 family)
MMPQEPARTARLEARIAPEILSLVRRAAELQGRSVSEFVVAAAQDAAQRAVTDLDLLRLSREAQEHFADQLLNPPAPNAALAKALARHRQLVIE